MMKLARNKKRSNKELSKKNSFIIILIFIFAVFLYAVISYIRVSNENKGLLKKKKTSNIKQIYVPLFIDPNKVIYKTRFNFTFDSPDILKDYRDSEKLDIVIENCKSDFEITKKLMAWSRKQWNPGRPDPYPPINAKSILSEIRNKRTGGFCAQYNYVFIQALQSFGIKSRYVTIKNHEVTEVWLKKFNKWVCFDPLYNSYYLDKNNTLLSVIEIYKNKKNDKFIKFSKEHLIEHTEKQLNKFIYFSVWIKNDHISFPINFSDIGYYKVYYVDDDNVSNKIPKNALFTTYKRDLYFNPNM